MLSGFVLLSGCWHPTVATVQPPTVPGYSHLLAIPMQDDDGAVNDWATTLYVPIHVDSTKKRTSRFLLRGARMYASYSFSPEFCAEVGMGKNQKRTL